MGDFLKQQRVPLFITAMALLLALAVGLVPVLKSGNDQTTNQQASRATIAALEARIAALESASTGLGDGAISPVLRAELDLIAKGLLNQTGRVSRLKKQVETVESEGDTMDPALRAELDLIAKGLLNQTGRVSRLKKRVETVESEGDAMGPALRAELDLIAKGLLNQTGRVSALKKNVAALSSLPGMVERIDLQVTNLNTAVGRLHQRLQSLTPSSPPSGDELAELRRYLAGIQEQVDGVRTSLETVTERFDSSVAAGADENGSLTAIEAKLDQILQSMAE